MPVSGLDHVQLAMPAGEEDAARDFYAGALGLVEEDKPAGLKAGGGCWFRGGTAHIHLGVDPDFRPARKAHPALIVTDLDALVARVREAGHDAAFDDRLPGRRRAFAFDPFGNRLELMEG